MKRKEISYIVKLISKYPSILSGRKKINENNERIAKTKRLIKDFIKKNKLY